MSFLLCSPRFSSSMLGPNIHLLSSHYWHINQLFSSYSLGFPLFINYPWLYLPFSQTLHLLACPHLPVLGCLLSHCSHREGTHIILVLLSIATFRITTPPPLYKYASIEGCVICYNLPSFACYFYCWLSRCYSHLLQNRAPRSYLSPSTLL